jgi:hypothetical protein
MGFSETDASPLPVELFWMEFTASAVSAELTAATPMANNVILP